MVASEVARAAGIHTSQLFRWRQQLCERAQFPAAFNPVAGRIRAGAGIARTDAGESWRHRHRVCYRRPDADHRRGRCFDVAALVCPLSTCRTIRSRPRGVSRAFLCMFIRDAKSNGGRSAFYDLPSALPIVSCFKASARRSGDQRKKRSGKLATRKQSAKRASAWRDDPAATKKRLTPSE